VHISTKAQKKRSIYGCVIYTQEKKTHIIHIMRVFFISPHVRENPKIFVLCAILVIS
jgi:hypothetical protein